MNEKEKIARIVGIIKDAAKPARKLSSSSQQADGDDIVQVGGKGDQIAKGNGIVQIAGSSHRVSISTPKVKVEIAPPTGSIGANPLLRSRIDRLFKQINEFRKENKGDAFSYGAIYGSFARAFGLKSAEWKDMWLWPESRADEVIAWLESARDNTQQGRVEKAAKRPGYQHTRGHLFRKEGEALGKLGLDGDSQQVRDLRRLLTGYSSRADMSDLAFANWVAHLEAEVRRAHGESGN